MTDAHLSPISIVLLDHIRHLVKAQRPFVTARVATELNRSQSSITNHLRALVVAGKVEIDRRHMHQSQATRVHVIGEGATPWPYPSDILRDDVAEIAQAKLVEWLDRNGWSQNQLARALAMIRGGGFNSSSINKFVRNGGGSDANKRDLAQFLAAYPSPGRFEAWLNRYEAQCQRRMDDNEIQRRREAREREIAERRAQLLANERRPWKRADNDDFRLDAATVAALSGGTLTSIRGNV